MELHVPQSAALLVLVDAKYSIQYHMEVITFHFYPHRASKESEFNKHNLLRERRSIVYAYIHNYLTWECICKQ